MKKLLFLFSFLFFVLLDNFSEDALFLMRKIDANSIYNTIKYEGELIIERGKKKYLKTFNAYGKGQNNNFIEFTNQDDLGTKYLKKDGNLFLYDPNAEKVIAIVEHLLKDSMVGSDMSNEDVINNDTLESRYTGVITGEIELDGKNVYVLELKAKTKKESYGKQIIYVEKETYTPIKTILCSSSGDKLKEMAILEVKKIGNRDFPTIVEMRDLKRKDSKTIMKMKSIVLDIDIPDSMFSMKMLEN